MTATATKPYQPTELEHEAQELEADALQLMQIAINLLGSAEAKLSEEEKKHSAISPSNQYNMMRYTEASNMLNEAWEHITGRPSITVISSNVTSIRRFCPATGEYVTSPVTGKFSTTDGA
jgi:hypothetical protein